VGISEAPKGLREGPPAVGAGVRQGCLAQVEGPGRHDGCLHFHEVGAPKSPAEARRAYNPAEARWARHPTEPEMDTRFVFSLR
jgi:hypothetical protein